MIGNRAFTALMVGWLLTSAVQAKPRPGDIAGVYPSAGPGDRKLYAIARVNPGAGPATTRSRRGGGSDSGAASRSSLLSVGVAARQVPLRRARGELRPRAVVGRQVCDSDRGEGSDAAGSGRGLQRTQRSRARLCAVEGFAPGTTGLSPPRRARAGAYLRGGAGVFAGPRPGEEAAGSGLSSAAAWRALETVRVVELELGQRRKRCVTRGSRQAAEVLRVLGLSQQLDPPPPERPGGEVPLRFKLHGGAADKLLQHSRTSELPILHQPCPNS